MHWEYGSCAPAPAPGCFAALRSAGRLYVSAVGIVAFLLSQRVGTAPHSVAHLDGRDHRIGCWEPACGVCQHMRRHHIGLVSSRDFKPTWLRVGYPQHEGSGASTASTRQADGTHLLAKSSTKCSANFVPRAVNCWCEAKWYGKLPVLCPAGAVSYVYARLAPKAGPPARPPYAGESRLRPQFKSKDSSRYHRCRWLFDQRRPWPKAADPGRNDDSSAVLR
jgi:hypothetical protein